MLHLWYRYHIVESRRCDRSGFSMSGEKRNSTRQTKRIGVREVACLAEVAPITVSRALSFPSAVAPATRERIMAAVSSLGYIPNRVAGSLSSNQTRLIGAIIPTFQ